MDDDDYPNFGNAFPSTASTVPASSAQTGSWHPALRPDSEPIDSDDDFFDRYPGATPKKQQQSQLSSSEVPGEEDRETKGGSIPSVEDPTPESPIRRQSISVEYMLDIRSDGASPADIQRGPSHHAHAEGPMSRRPQQDEEAPILRPEDDAAQQVKSLEELAPDIPQDLEATQLVAEKTQQIDHAQKERTQEDAGLTQHYDYQGESTEMEEALESSDSAPLLLNEQAPPTPGDMSRESTWNVDTPEASLLSSPSQSNDASLSVRRVPPTLDRTFTSNFSEPPLDPPAQQHAPLPDSEDWPAFGDDRTFGELLDVPAARGEESERPDQTAAEEAEQVSAPDMQPAIDAETGEKDLTAAWSAAFDDDDILEQAPADVDPSAFFGDDDDGFLEDDVLASTQQIPIQESQRHNQQDQYTPASVQQQPQQSYFALASPQVFDGGHGRSAGTPTTGLFDVYNEPGAVQQPQQQRQDQSQRPGLSHAQSFADKAKGGYQSPYDLPMEVVKPRRRVQAQQPTGTQMPAPPPRTSSQSGSMGQPPPPRTASVSSLSPPSSSGPGAANPAALPSRGAASTQSTPKTDAGFFADLPMAAKPRARPAGGYTPQASAAPGLPTPPLGPMSPPQQYSLQAPPFASIQPLQRPIVSNPAPPQRSAIYGGLQQAERLPLLPEQPSAPALGVTRPLPSSQPDIHPPPIPAVQNRYSPAPTASASAVSRYSPAPSQPHGRSSAGAPPINPPRHPSHQFAPRTSSPLAAHVDKPQPPLPQEVSVVPSVSPPKVNGSMQEKAFASDFLPQRNTRVAPPDQSYISSVYAPQDVRAATATFQVPPPRPRTQSPDNTTQPSAAYGAHVRRPSTATGKTSVLPSISAPTRPPRQGLTHRRQFSRDLSYIVPSDERSQDPLQRWKGYPILKWTAGGTVLTCFPKQTPVYAAGQSSPSIKCNPGLVQVQDASKFMPMEERNASFPGPLTARSKGKKKDVLTWMTGKIEDLQRRTENALLDFSMPEDSRKRVEEKLLLWKIMRIFVEHDGILEGDPRVEEEVRRILLPNLAQLGQLMDLPTPTSASVSTEPIDKQILYQIRQALFEGQRERAVWLAEEKKLWGHALLIASTMGPETWKQIVQAFVRSEVKTAGSDARSLAALYQVFAGNSDECVDELVPPSARAGFQMINKDGGSVTKNPLDGLDSWRETLALVTSNRTATDGPSLIALGKLLSSYGRVEAAHICFLFARALVKVSGADDSGAQLVLLGGDHRTSATEALGGDLDSIVLTEIYEYACSLSAPSTGTQYLPHLQAYKLIHAHDLAAYGLKSKAQTYCDHITTAYTSTTRPSPYYHPYLTQSVADLGAFLSQTPHDGKTGFLSKPALNKVSSGAASWFTKFVAGEDDQMSTGSGPGGASGDEMAGPFGRVSGGTPTLSRQGSSTDLYSSMMGGAGAVPIPGVHAPQSTPFAPSSAPGRYAPAAQMSGGASKYAPQHAYAGSAVPAAEPERPSSARYAPAAPVSIVPQNLVVPRPEASRALSDYGVQYQPDSRRGSAQDTVGSQTSYEPRPFLEDDTSAAYSPPVLAPPTREPFESIAMEPPRPESEPTAPADAEFGGGYQPPSESYEPPSYSYQPYEPEPDSPEDLKPKPRKTYGDDDDDDDDFAKRAAAAKKAQADRAADEAFRKAAEADAGRDQGGVDGKKGWFGGWFGGKKDPNAPAVHRAKLGEENSFYYDETLKKWVNKKAGADSASPAGAAATPPPPKGPMARLAGPPSGASGPPSAPPSRPPTGAGMLASARPPTSGSAGPPSRTSTPASVQSFSQPTPSDAPAFAAMNGDVPTPPASVPPPSISRPATGLSAASSIDDLLAGPPGAGRKAGGTVKGKKKGGRYVDVMAK